LKRPTVIFLTIAVILSAALQSLFAVFYVRISDFYLFSTLRKKIEKTARLSCGIEDSFAGFTKSRSIAILKLPSCTADRIILSGVTDHAVIMADKNVLVFSIYPSDTGARKHISFYMKNTGAVDFNYAGGLFGFRCGTGRSSYARNFYIMQGLYLIPPGLEAF
jgi:hypothetical protein